MSVQDMDFFEKICLFAIGLIGLFAAFIALIDYFLGDKKAVSKSLTISTYAFAFIIIEQNIIMLILSKGN